MVKEIFKENKYLTLAIILLIANIPYAYSNFEEALPILTAYMIFIFTPFEKNGKNIFLLLYSLSFLFFYPIMANITLLFEYIYGEKKILFFNPFGLYYFDIFILSSFISYRLFKGIKTKNIKINYKFSNIKIFILFSIFILTIMVRIVTHLYFHIGVDENYNRDSGNIQNLLDKLHLIGLCSIPIMIYEYKNKPSKFNLCFLILIILLPVVLYLPSGSRTMMMGHLPVVLMILISIFNVNYKFIVTSILLLFFLVFFSGLLRTDEKINELAFSGGLEIVIHRLGDFRNSTIVIDYVKANEEYRNFDNLENIYQLYWPNFIRTGFENPLDFNEGVKYTENIGLGIETRSEPITIVGDAYSRFGIYGIILIGFIMGMSIRFCDLIFKVFPLYFSLVFFFIYSRFVFQFYTSSILVFFVSILRELPIAIILSYLIFKILFPLNKNTLKTKVGYAFDGATHNK